MTDHPVPAPDEDRRLLAEIGGAVQATIHRHLAGATGEWRQLLRDLEGKYEVAKWRDVGDREHLKELLDFTRHAVSGLDRIAEHGPPKHDHLTPHDFSWYDVTGELERDEGAGRELWGRIKRAARDELRAGAVASRAVEGYHGRPMERAEYIALWVALADGLKPADGAERLLIDNMAQALILHRRWLRRMVEYDSLEATRLDKSARESGSYQPPRLSETETVDRAMAMADRFQRQFLRLLKAYRDQRRILGTVVVAAGGQLNVGEQQVNVSGTTLGTLGGEPAGGLTEMTAR